MANEVSLARQLNQEGASCFAQGDFVAALPKFRRALEGVVSQNVPDLVQVAEPLKPQELPSAALIGITHLELPEGYGKELESKGPFVYMKPLVFQESFLPDSVDGTAILCAVIVWNMAVTFHVQYLEEGKPRMGIKARKLYESSINLFTKISDQCDLSIPIAIALNNKASISFEVGDFEACEYELDRLRWYVSQVGQSPNSTDILTVDEFQGILLNLLLLHPPAVAEAA